MEDRSVSAEAIVAAVLAGGESRRMGRDKAWVEFEGRPLLERSVATLRSVFEQVVVIGPADRGYDRVGVDVVPDVQPGLGPVGGILTALQAANGESVFVLACDMPRVSPELIRWLIDVASESARPAAAVVAHDGRRPQPLCGLYRPSATPVLERAVAEQRLEASALLSTLDAEVVSLDANLSWYRPDLLLNVNEPPENRFPARATQRVTMQRRDRSRTRSLMDRVAVEEPLEIRVVSEEAGRRQSHSVAVTMRTPGEDFELAAGFLHSEGVIGRAEDIWKISHCRQAGDPEGENVVEVFVTPSVSFDVERLSRHVMVSSACGVCGRSSIDTVLQECRILPDSGLKIPVEGLFELESRLATRQPAFSRTGGLHAAALCSPATEILELREDVGRHNALDKLVGRLLLDGLLPASDRLLLLSGRLSFELVQKAVLAGIPAIAAIGAPSSLAIELARACDVTLIGFLGADRFNVYSRPDRLDRG